MKVEVRLFAGLAEAAGVRAIELDWEGGTARDLVGRLAELRPELARGLAACRVAADQKFVDLDDTVDRAREIAVIPPVSGGAR